MLTEELGIQIEVRVIELRDRDREDLLSDDGI